MADPTSGTAPTEPVEEVLDPEVLELWSSRALLIICMHMSMIQHLSILTEVLDGRIVFLLILSFWVSYYLKVRRIKSIHETIVALFAGQ